MCIRMLGLKRTGLLFFIFIYLAVSGLSRRTWDLLLQRTDSGCGATGSVGAVCKVSCREAGGILPPQAGIDPTSTALQGGFFLLLLYFFPIIFIS